jgi:ABC-type ATPase with predicted acetyltransferase domain
MIVSFLIGFLIGAMLWPLYAVFHYLSYVKRRRQYFIQLKEVAVQDEETQRRMKQIERLDQPEESRAYTNIWEALEDDEQEQKRLTALSGALHTLQREKIERGDALVMTPEMTFVVSRGMISKITMADIFGIYRHNKMDTAPLEQVCNIFNQPIPE